MMASTYKTRTLNCFYNELWKKTTKSNKTFNAILQTVPNGNDNSPIVCTNENSAWKITYSVSINSCWLPPPNVIAVSWLMLTLRTAFERVPERHVSGPYAPIEILRDLSFCSLCDLGQGRGTRLNASRWNKILFSTKPFLRRYVCPNI